MSKKKPARSPSETGPSVPSGSPMDVNLLQQIVQLMTANDLNTVDVREGSRRIVLKRGAAVPPAAVPPLPVQQHSATTAQAGTPADSEAGLIAIRSPMVGTFYAAPSPDAKPFVQVGSVVDEDTDVCIIEAMKVFNNIKAECRGTIAKILASNGQTVEYGQVLFLVRPA